MGDKICEAMQEVYREGRFSHEKKLETKRKAMRQERLWKPYLFTAIMTCAVVLLLVFLVKIEPIPPEVAWSETTGNVEKLYMERWQQYNEVVAADFREKERTAYLATSDFSLQQSILNRHYEPSLAQLLSYMSYVVGNKEYTTILPKNMTFAQLTAQAPKLVQQLEQQYGPIQMMTFPTEKLPNMNVFYMDVWQIVGSLAIFSFFAYLLYSNLRGNRNYIFATIQIAILLMMIISMLSPLNEQYVTNEEELLAQSIAPYQEFMGEWTNISQAKIAHIASFGNRLDVLVKLEDDICVYATFQQDDKGRGFIYQSSVWGRNEVMTSAAPTVREQDGTAIIFAVPANSHVKRITMKNNATGEVTTLDHLAQEGGIYYLAHPTSDGDITINYFDENGQLLKEQ